MIKLPLAGKYARLSVLVDEADLELVSDFSWTYAQRGQTAYARRRWTEDGKHKGQYMHALLTGWSMADHINGNGLDNRRANLRPVQSLENNRNSRKPKSFRGRLPTSKYKGVSMHQGRWRSCIKVSYRQVHLGMFAAEIDAALAYDEAARRYHGDFAALNFPEGTR